MPIALRFSSEYPTGLLRVVIMGGGRWKRTGKRRARWIGEWQKAILL